MCGILRNNCSDFSLFMIQLTFLLGLPVHLRLEQIEITPHLVILSLAKNFRVFNSSAKTALKDGLSHQCIE